MNKYIIIILMTTVVWSTACKRKKRKGNINCSISNSVGTKPLVLGTEKFVINGTDTVTFSGFKYMISNIELYEDGDLKYSENNSYHLINESEAATKQFEIDSIPIGNYDEIRLAIGVDLLSDNSSAQGGDLGTDNGLFWISWGSYIYFRVDGSYYDSQKYTLSNHLGGENTYAVYDINLSKDIEIGKNKSTSLEIKLDLEQLYTSPKSMSLSDEINRVVASKGNSMDTYGINLKTGIISIGAIGSPK